MCSFRLKGMAARMLVVSCLLLVTSQANGAEAWLWGAEQWQTSTSGDRIDNVSMYGERGYLPVYNVGVGPINGASVKITLPAGLSRWDPERNTYARWDSVTGTLTFDAVGALGTNENLGGDIDRLTTLAYETPAVAATRAISNPVFADPGDVETRTVTVTMNVLSGALSGWNQLSVDLVSPWDLPEGLTMQSVTGVSIPSGFSQTGTPGSYYVDNTAGLGGLAGTYSFSADVTFARSGDLRQSTLGNLYFKPPSRVWYSNQTQLGPLSGTSISTNLDTGVDATFSAGQTVDFNGNKNVGMKDLRFYTIAVADDSPGVPSGIEVIKEKRKTVTGQMVYSFSVNVGGQNLVGATVTTPGAATYDMVLEEDWGLFLERTTTDLSELDEFGTGDYTVKVTGSDGVTQTYVVALSGDFPSEFPAFDQSMGFETTNRRPTISCATPSDGSIILAHMDYELDDYRFEDFVDLSAISHTPTDNLSLGNGWASVAFGAGQQGTTNGVDYLSGFITTSDIYFNVVPEPGTVLLVGTGILGVLGWLRRRRMR